MTSKASEVETLRAEVAELRKLVMELMAHGVTVTHIHRGPSPLEQQPWPYTRPVPMPQHPYPWSPYQGVTCGVSIGVCDPNIMTYNGSSA